MERMKLGVLVSGRGSNLQALIDSIGSGALDARISIVISDNPRAYALERAAAAGIRGVSVPKEGFAGEGRFRAIADLLGDAGVDLVVLAGFMRIIPEWFVDKYSGRMINIHPSLLPSFPGLHAQRQALDHGVKVSGCTVHFVDHGCDTGPIIMQTAVPVLDDDDEDSLSARILEREHVLLPTVIGLIGAGRVAVDGRRVRVYGDSSLVK